MDPDKEKQKQNSSSVDNISEKNQQKNKQEKNCE
jgi:hypothetical protein